MVTTNLKSLKVSSNRSRRTFTIRKYYVDGSIVKYRTIRYPLCVFDAMTYNTLNDWLYFLRHSDEYYLVFWRH